mmetsp:Transcript_8183/g.19568  ORF Transcript_8183/g.19568 Transcript_8183/m.19568 type:complete len:572 (+) Transcript_8183:38-1753(+)
MRTVGLFLYAAVLGTVFVALKTQQRGKVRRGFVAAAAASRDEPGWTNATWPRDQITLGLGDGAGRECAQPDADKDCCTHDALEVRQCSAIQQDCSLTTGNQFLVDYYGFFFCTLGGSWFGYVLFAVWFVWLCLCLSNTTDAFLVPQLETLSKDMRLSPATAGVTLLAFGNSAPDVFDIIAAVPEGQFPVALGNLLGDCVFLTTIVLAQVILVSTKPGAKAKVCAVDKKTFLRDTVALGVAVATILVLAASMGKFYVWSAAIVLGVYVAYVIYVVLTQEVEQVEEEEAGVGNSLVASEIHSMIEEDADSSMWDRIQSGLVYPVTLLQTVTIANCSHEWSRNRRMIASVAPMGTVFIVTLDFGPYWTGGSPYDGFARLSFLVSMVVAAALGVAIWFTSTDGRAPRYSLALLLMANVATIAWLDLFGNEIVALLQVLGALSQISRKASGTALLGYLPLAWVNCIGDFIADPAVARAGYPAMGVASVFGSPLLTAGVGIGFAALLGCLTSAHGNVSTPLSSIVWISAGAFAFSLLSSLFVIPRNGYCIPRRFSLVLYAIYAVYMVGTITSVFALE